MQELVSDLMVEEWITNISYEKYYAQCASLACTYSKVDRHDGLYVLTNVIGSFGGLTIVLRFIILLSVGFIRRKKDNIPIPRLLGMYNIPIIESTTPKNRTNLLVCKSDF